MTEPTEPAQTPGQTPPETPKGPLLRDGKVHLSAAVAGFIVASTIALISGNPAAWATPMYFVLGWPVMCATVYWLARAYPQSSWRWTMSMMLGQVFSSILFGNANLIIQAMLFVTVLSAPQFAAGVLGAKAGFSKQNADTEDSSPQDPL